MVYSSNTSDPESDLSDFNENEEHSLRLENGRGVCILSTDGRDEDGEQYQLNQEQLTSLLLRPGVAERPVVLISVAGAFRGGKSFLLDFFLRYLYAEESARADGSWLGSASAPLRGFGWRGGCDRDTTGLVLWSQLFPITLPSGEQVSVLLMDTQGSFDEESSLRDCSMIFALSTLLSSVQVYNLSQKINENDLQHLQVFTEYAEQGGGELPALQLLVRDWCTPYQFPFGADGGERYLAHKLEERPTQPRELREVRRRLRESFERVGCFLLPHPGLCAASDPAFDGQLSVLTEDFKQSLRELVPQLLAPENLRVKMLEGRPMLARELAVHVQAYFDAFRNHVPSPQSIMTAMALARWHSAAAAARASLTAAARGTRAFGRDALLARLRTARPPIDALRPLAERAGDMLGLDALEKELDDQIAEYVKINDGKIALAVAAAKSEWESYSRELLAPALCLHPSDPQLDAAAARAAAVARYDQLVDDADYDDTVRAQLITELEERSAETLRVAVDINERNNATAVEASLLALEGALPSHPHVNTVDLAHTHADARSDAIAVFLAARTRPSARDIPDPYLEDLEQQIETALNSHSEENTINNSRVASMAQDAYSRTMQLSRHCRHPRDLRETHEAALQRAVTAVCDRSGPNASRHDDVVVQLKTWIDGHYADIMNLNDRKNNLAIEEAYKVFNTHMDKGIFQLSAQDFQAKLRKATNAANEVLKQARASLHYFGVDDDYYNILQRRMQGRYEHYRVINSQRKSIGELAVGVGAAALTTAAALGSTPTRVVAAAAAIGGALLNARRN